MNVTIDGGAQTTNDHVTVLGTTASDLLSVLPSASDAAIVTLDGRQPLNLTSTEALSFDGMEDDDEIVVMGDPNDNHFLHLPGIASDTAVSTSTMKPMS